MSLSISSMKVYMQRRLARLTLMNRLFKYGLRFILEHLQPQLLQNNNKITYEMSISKLCIHIINLTGANRGDSGYRI